MKLKGTVMEVNPDTAIVMTTGCDFVEIRKRGNLEPGQEIEFASLDIIRPKKRPARLAYLALAACLALLLVCFPVYNSLFNHRAGTAVAYVSVDINPSLELAVDKNSLVVSTAAFNADGEKLLQKVSLVGQPVDRAIVMVIEIAAELRYLPVNEPGQVLVCLAPAGEGEEPPAAFFSAMDEQLAELGNATGTAITVISSTAGQHREALQQGFSPGRYALWKKSGANNREHLEQFRNGKLADIMKEPRGLANGKDNGNRNGNGNKPKPATGDRGPANRGNETQNANNGNGAKKNNQPAPGRDKNSGIQEEQGDNAQPIATTPGQNTTGDRDNRQQPDDNATVEKPGKQPNEVTPGGRNSGTSGGTGSGPGRTGASSGSGNK